jgi:hypothetical protein
MNQITIFKINCYQLIQQISRILYCAAKTTKNTYYSMEYITMNKKAVNKKANLL